MHIRVQYLCKYVLHSRQISRKALSISCTIIRFGRDKWKIIIASEFGYQRRIVLSSYYVYNLEFNYNK